MITKLSGEGLWFTSDTHFNHANILKFTNRPFENVTEHDEALIKNWNDRVGVNDTVFHLGDFCFGSSQKIVEIRERLNGNIVLIRGNHDDKNIQRSLWGLFDEVLYQARIWIDGRTVYLNHFPFLCFAHGSYELYGDDYSINLFGHVHSGPNCATDDGSRLRMLYPTQYDVGVDNNGYSPISWNEVKTIIESNIEKHKLSKENGTL